MHLAGKPVASFDPEGLIFSVGVESKMVKLYDLRSFDKVCDVMSNGGSSMGNLGQMPPPHFPPLPCPFRKS